MSADEEAELQRRLIDPADVATDTNGRPNDLSSSSPSSSFWRPTQGSRKRPLGPVEQLLLAPYDKWTAYRRFPTKLVLHVILLILTATHLALYDAQNAAYVRASHRNWAFFFLPPSNDVGVTPRYQRELSTINETVTAVHFIRDAYFSVANTSVANYEYIRNETSHEIQSLRLRVVRKKGPSTTTTTEYAVDQHSAAVGPFSPALSRRQQAALVRSIESVQFAFSLRDRQDGSFYSECFEWGVSLSLRSVQHARLSVQLDECELTRCQVQSPVSLWRVLQQRFLWLHLVVLSVVLLYMALSIKALARSLRLMTHASSLLRDQAQQQQQQSQGSPLPGSSYTDIPWSLKLQMVNGLQMVVLLALSLLLWSSVWSLFLLTAHVPLHYWHRLLHATAVLLLWACLVGYLGHNRHIYSIVLTLKWGVPRVLQFLVGVSPIFIGYALFGTIYFGNKIAAFGSLSSSMTTLFAVMNGDIILDTFDMFELHRYALSGKIYLYSFISLFIYVVLNIFIAIVEEAFFATRSTKRLLSSVLMDPNVTRSNESEISAEMVRTLLRLLDQASEGRDERER